MLQASTPTKNILTVSKLNQMARSVLESQIGQIWLSAEVSNFVAAASGHWYFTLKDSRAQVKAAMFKGANRKVQHKPKEGDKLLVRANIGLYEPRGDYQLIVEHIEPEGEGLLKQQFEALKLKLLAEGLFDQSHKSKLPDTVLKVGIITSPTGAALHDILTVLARRNPAIEVVIYPTQVQGDLAPSLICQAIAMANQRQEVDVLILGRGGGSIEDLWCFNDEQVARSIFASKLPIISAVGHEVDISIADFTADMRAPTPSAAAELVSQDQLALLEQSINQQNRLIKAFASILQLHKQKQSTLEQGLLRNHPQKRLEQKSQFIDQLQAQLTSLMQQKLTHKKQHNQHLLSRLSLCSPRQTVQRHQHNHQDIKSRLLKSMQLLLTAKQQALANNMHLLDTVSPLSTLARGYSISYKNNEILTNSKTLHPGDTLITRLAEGEVRSTVEQVN
ncbi:exodeoxyribonuclease VII large subunit [Paraglaciecola aestuariivivens]